ncbi:MAG: hypothetical protein HGB15_02395 [Chlorobaculum sp.]|jgi:hypothetical protein|nr:hypothetical protein [Chlorobaculum sp.]
MKSAAEDHSLPESGAPPKLTTQWIGALALALAGAFVPRPEFRYGFLMIDTVIHLVIFVFLAFIPMICFRNRKTTFLLAISMAPFGYLLETLHVMVTGENFNAINALVNNAGVLAGIAAGFVLRLKLHYERRTPDPRSEE